VELKELVDRIKTSETKIYDLVEKQADEIRQHGETSTQTRDRLAEFEKSYEEQQTEKATAIKALQDQVDQIVAEAERKGRIGGGDFKSAGTQYTESEAFKKMMSDHAEKSDWVPVGGAFRQKALITEGSATSAGALLVPSRQPGILNIQYEQPRIRDLLNVQRPDSPTIEWVVETGFTNNAAPVAEVINDPTLKPESAIALDIESATAKTIAHWIPITRAALNDVAQIRAYIDTRLLLGLELVEEAQFLYGSGLSNNQQGFLTHPDRQQYSIASVPGQTKIDAIRRAMTLSRVAQYPVTGIVMNPFDWEDIELAKGSDGHYIWINITVGGEMRMFRVPVVDTTAILEGTALTGAFGLAAMLWDLEQGNVRVGEPGNYFLQNKVAILAEERVLLTIFRPEAFVEVTLEEAS
jgi:HK97 family phage major capsid protein